MTPTEPEADLAAPWPPTRRRRRGRVARWRALLAALDPFRRRRHVQRRHALRRHLRLLHEQLAELHARAMTACGLLVGELHDAPGHASARIIDSVRDGRRTLKTYQLAFAPTRPEALQAWHDEGARLELFAHLLGRASVAFRGLRTPLRTVLAGEAATLAALEAYYAALADFLTLRSRGTLTFRAWPERDGGWRRLDVGPRVDVEALAEAVRRPAPQGLTLLVYERTDESVTRDLGELLEGALFTKRARWRMVASAFAELDERLAA